MSHRYWDQVRVPDTGAAGMHRTMLVKSASMYSELQGQRSDIESIIPHPDYLEANPELIQPKKLINPVKASKSHQELHRELLMNHKRGMSLDKPELQRVLQHRRRDQLIRQRKEEEEAKKLQSPFEQELLKRHQRLEQLEQRQQLHIEERAPEFIKVKENLRRTATISTEEKAV